MKNGKTKKEMIEELRKVPLVKHSTILNSSPRAVIESLYREAKRLGYIKSQSQKVEKPKTIVDKLREQGVKTVDCAGSPYEYRDKEVALEDFDMYNFQVIRVEGNKAIALWLD